MFSEAGLGWGWDRWRGQTGSEGTSLSPHMVTATGFIPETVQSGVKCTGQAPGPRKVGRVEAHCPLTPYLPASPDISVHQARPDIDGFICTKHAGQLLPHLAVTGITTVCCHHQHHTGLS